MGQLGGVGDDVVVLGGGGDLQVAEAQLPQQGPDLGHTALRRVVVRGEDQGCPLEQLREGIRVAGTFDARHGVAADKMEAVLLGHRLQRHTDHGLDTAGVHHQPALAELILVSRHIVHGGLGVQGHHHQVAGLQPIGGENTVERPFLHGPAEHRAVGVIAVQCAVSVGPDGLGNAAADEPQAHHANCLDHGCLLTPGPAGRW